MIAIITPVYGWFAEGFLNSMTPHSNHYGAILADAPWDHITWSRKGKGRSAAAHYDCMPLADIERCR